jgi:hypothetical protein
MATSMAQPGGSPQAQGDSSNSQLSQVQQFLAQWAMQARQVGNQMTPIQPEMQQISQLLVQALQKISQAAPGPPQQQATPGMQ